MLSIEIFVPRSADAAADRIDALLSDASAAGASLVSISGPANGASIQMARRVKAAGMKAQVQLEPAKLTAAEMSGFLDSAIDAGVGHLLLLGGDTANAVGTIKSRLGGSLNIAVCGFPRGSVDPTTTYEAALQATRAQLAAGADSVLAMPVLEAASFELEVRC